MCMAVHRRWSCAVVVMVCKQSIMSVCFSKISIHSREHKGAQS